MCMQLTQYLRRVLRIDRYQSYLTAVADGKTTIKTQGLHPHELIEVRLCCCVCVWVCLHPSLCLFT